MIQLAKIGGQFVPGISDGAVNLMFTVYFLFTMYIFIQISRGHS